MKVWVNAVLVLVLGFAWTVDAQDPDHVLSIGSTTLATGNQADVANNYDNTSAMSLAGWSWGNCIVDPAIIDIIAVAEGETTLTVNGGDPPAFIAPAIFPGEGWTIGVVIDFFGNNPLPPGIGYELHLATYVGLAKGSSDVCYCGTLGTPVVEVTLVDTDGGAITPTTSCGSLAVVTGSILFRFAAEDQIVTYDPMMDTVTVDETISIEEDAGSPGFPNDTAGFSMGLAHDPATVTIDALDSTPLESPLGGPADFFGPNLLPDGWTVGVVYSFTGRPALAFNGPTPVIEAGYTIAGLLGDVVGQTRDLIWVNTLGTPPVTNTVVVGVVTQAVEFEDGLIDLQPVLDEPFRRGDCNDDGTLNIADGIHILAILFQGVDPIGNCLEACDANDDGFMDTSDAVFIFNYQLFTGPLPPAPFPDCGIEAMAPCEAYISC